MYKVLNFLEDTFSCKVDVPTRLDFNTWNYQLFESHLKVVENFNVEDEHITVTKKNLKQYMDCENRYLQNTCETDNLCAESKIDILRKKDDENMKCKHNFLKNIIEIKK